MQREFDGHRRSLRSCSAFTLIDAVAAVLIVAILLILLIPEMAGIKERAAAVRCASNMRSINLALRGYLLDHEEVWPQGPSPDQEQAWEQFWLEALKNYGIDPKTWQCPTINSQLASQGSTSADRPRIHYTPTLFDDTPGIANKWATHPWLIERSDVHGQGPLICFPDGSIKPFDKVLAELGVR
ncbi:MAG: hypothetical protein IAE97_08025 [Chthoniobacterales bacterium]|nr:hypothetical protein [Chthoniobacterales bacterium]